MNLNTLKYFTVLLLSICSLNAPNSYGQELNLGKKLNSELYDSNLTNFNKKEASYLSLGLGTSTYKFINLYSIDANIIFPFLQKLYLKMGFIVYDDIKYDPNDSKPFPFYFNLYFLHMWEVSRKVNIFGGIGLSFFPVGGAIYNIDIITNYKLSNHFFLGLELKQGLNFGKNSSKYSKVPFLSLNLQIII